MIKIEASSIEEVLLIHNSGVLISHASRRSKDDIDRDIFSGMFTAVQEFIKDSFSGKVDKNLKKMAFGEQMIYIEQGNNIFIIAIVEGSGHIFLSLQMMEVLKEVEGKYGSILNDWTGDMRQLKGIDDITNKLLQVTGDTGLRRISFTEELLGGVILDDGKMFVPKPEEEGEEETKPEEEKLKIESEEQTPVQVKLIRKRKKRIMLKRKK